MATQNLVVGTVPKNLVDELSLESGTSYRMTPASGVEVQIAELPLPLAPDTDSFLGHPVRGKQNELFTVGEEGIWVWTSSSETSIVCTEG